MKTSLNTNGRNPAEEELENASRELRNGVVNLKMTESNSQMTESSCQGLAGKGKQSV